MDFEQKYSQKKTKNKNIAQRNNQEILVRYLILIFCQESLNIITPFKKK